MACSDNNICSYKYVESLKPKTLPSNNIFKTCVVEVWDFTYGENHQSNLEISKHFMNVTCTKTIKTNDKRIGLSLNLKHEIKRTKIITQILKSKTWNVYDQNINRFLLQ